MPIPDQVSVGDSGHIQDHNDISSELTNINTGLSNKLSLSGGTLTGTLSGTSATFSGTVTAATPTSSVHLATKGYVDQNSSTSFTRSINSLNSNYTLALSDKENIITFTSIANLTIPNDSSVNFSPASKIILFQTGSNTINILAESGVEIVNRGDLGTTTSGEWKEAELLKIGPNTWSVLGDFNASAGRALFAGGLYHNTIDYITMTTSGNATDFGDIYAQVAGISAAGSSTRAVFAGGGTSTNVYPTSIGYVTFSSLGNTTNFGSLVQARYAGAALSSSTRAVFIGGAFASGAGNANLNMEYITIDTTGNGTNFGNMLEQRTQFATAASSTRGIFANGGYLTVLSSIEYITIATTGNSAAFGNLNPGGFGPSAGSSNTRAIFQVGNIAESKMQYITIATTGNGTDFGTLIYPISYSMGTASRTAAFFGGSTSSLTNKIQRVLISTLGNSTEFGNLTVSRGWGAATSNAHGGIAE